MSLDKYVMRGYTASTGQSTGQWVAQQSQQQAPASQPPSHVHQGASFVMGGSGKLQTDERARSRRGIPGNEYDFDVEAVRGWGTSHHPYYGNGPGFGNGYSGLYGTPGSQKMIMFLLCIAVGIIALFLKYGGKGIGEKANRGAPIMVKEGTYIMKRANHPAWSRD